MSPGAGNTYTDLEIRILEKQERGYPVEITFNGDQEFPRGFLNGSAQPQVDSASLEETGSRLFQWLFAAPELNTAWAQARGRHPLRRIRLRIDATAPELHALPWELLRDPGDGVTPQTLAAMEATPFSRYLAGQWIPGSPILKRPIRILVAVANPSDLAAFRLTPIDRESEWNILRQAVAGDRSIELVQLPEPCTLPALEAALRKGIHILYLVAHGQFFKDSAQAVLYLARENNEVDVVKDSDLSAMFARQLMDGAISQDDKLRLVHLSSCQTAVRSPADAFRGLAPQLVASGVPAVIAMQDRVPIDVAQSFSRVFYHELLDHGEVDRASNAARSSLLSAGMRGAAIPVLFMRLRYGQIFANPRFGVFLSYHPADAPVVEELAARMRDAGVQPWFDKWNMAPGTSWQQALDPALHQSSACAVFMGPGGQAPWQNEQVRMAIDQRVRGSRGEFRVIPVLLPGARRELRSKLPTFLVSTTWVEFADSLDNDHVFYRFLCGVRGQEPGAQPGEAITLTGNPYRGLEYFDIEHRDFFFGREALIGWLIDALRLSPGARENRFLALIGPSGSGKSSLARAGLLAAIGAGQLPGSAQWPIAVLLPGAQPLENLAIALATFTGTEKTPAAIRSQAEEYRQSERTLALSAALGLSATPSRRLVILVDQFEEVFTQCSDASVRQALIDNLMVAANEPGGQTIVVLTLRADLYGECSGHPVLAAALSDHQVLVGPMQEVELRRAIERPALLAGAEFEHGLVNALLDEVRDQPGSLPLLEDTLLELWQRREGRKLTHAGYQAIGKVAGALERRAEEVYANCSGPGQQILRRVFLRLVQSIEGGGSARRRVTLEELRPADGDSKQVEEMVYRLAGPQARLLTLQAQGSVDYIDIAHEALIRSWPRLRTWMDEDQEFQLWLKRLNARRLEWERTLRHPDSLLRGVLLDEAERWLQVRPEDLNLEEKGFVEASLFVRSMREEEARQQRQELEAEQQRRLEAETERATLKAKSAERLRRLARVLAASLVVVLCAAGFATYQKIQADRARTRSASLDLANISESLADADLRVLLALHSTALAHTQQAEEALYLAVQALRGPRFYSAGQNYEVLNIAASSDGRFVATANTDDTVTLWNAQDGTRIGAPLKIESGAAGVFFQAGGTLAVATAQGSVRIVNPSGGPMQSEVGVSQKEVKSVAASGDGSMFAVADQDASLAVWTFPAGPLKWLAGHGVPVLALAFSPGDGRYLVTADGNGSVIGWDVKSGNPVFHADTKERSPFTAVAISPDGRAAVTGDAAGMLRVWDLPSGRPLDRQQHAAWKRIEGAAFSADGRTLLSAGVDGRLKFWNVLPGGELAERLAVPCGVGNRLRCTAVAFLADGRTAAVAGLNGEIRLYQTDFAKLFDEARNLVDPRQINPQDCMKFLRRQTCDVPARIGPAR
jgi:hypothetical protein